MITLTDTAAVKVKELLAAEGADDLALRVAVRPGGCSGFSYEMFFDGDIAADDEQAQFGPDGTVQGRRRPGVGPAPRRRHARLQGRSRPVRVRHHEPERHAHLRLRPELQLIPFRLDGRAVEVADDGASLLEVAPRPPRRALAEGRLQPAGPVRLLHGLDRRPTARRLRDAARPRRRPRRHDARRPARRRRLDRRVRGGRRVAVRVLHARDRDARRRARASARTASPAAVHRALAAHLCRCTGWQPIVDAVVSFDPDRVAPDPARRPARAHAGGRRWRAHTAQRRRAGRRGGGGGFADDTAPADALVAIRDDDGRLARRPRRLTAGPRRSPGACRAGARRRRRRGRSTCPPATGRARCRRRGSSRPTSSPTRRGARRAASR